VIQPDGTSNNESLATITEVNGTKTLAINGTLPNGTDTSATGAAMGRAAVDLLGYLVMVATVGLTVFVL
jgi:hypothetical protein